jgi:hypothetical protein
LPEESQRILNTIPDSIGCELEDGQGEGGAELATVEQFTFKPEDIQEGIAAIFDWMGKHVGEHCKLSERQLSFVSGPTTQVLNASIGGITEWMPGFLQRWCETTPGAAAFLFAWGVVLTPMGIMHIGKMRERALERKRGGVPKIEEVPTHQQQPERPRQPGVPKIHWEPQQ